MNASKDSSFTLRNPFSQMMGQLVQPQPQDQQPPPGQLGLDPNMNQFAVNKFWQGGPGTIIGNATGNNTDNNTGNPIWNHPTNHTNPTNPTWNNATIPTNPANIISPNCNQPVINIYDPQCPSLHPLALTTHLPHKYTGNRFNCNKCGKTEMASSTNQAWHCDFCSYDVCRPCAKV